jgi:hypothetical protein
VTIVIEIPRRQFGGCPESVEYSPCSIQQGNNPRDLFISNCGSGIGLASASDWHPQHHAHEDGS